MGHEDEANRDRLRELYAEFVEERCDCCGLFSACECPADGPLSKRNRLAGFRGDPDITLEDLIAESDSDAAREARARRAAVAPVVTFETFCELLPQVEAALREQGIPMAEEFYGVAWWNELWNQANELVRVRPRD